MSCMKNSADRNELRTVRQFGTILFLETGVQYSLLTCLTHDCKTSAFDTIQSIFLHRPWVTQVTPGQVKTGQGRRCCGSAVDTVYWHTIMPFNSRSKVYILGYAGVVLATVVGSIGLGAPGWFVARRDTSELFLGLWQACARGYGEFDCGYIGYTSFDSKSNE